ncbi:MAG TPA: PilC/PilY family type IV pilus protein [Gammaproteobacteria bacterium]|jgi:type IV pilus assembly protein PilY1
MNIKIWRFEGTRAAIGKACHVLAAVVLTVLPVYAASAQVAQTPLYLGGGNVPGNLVLVPSVEWPTITSVSSLGDYSENEEYLGYFDPGKCYRYSYNNTEALRHFYPVRFASNHRCTDVNEWSGNFMNWAATQTIDPFRWVLTGGYRVRDTATETWIEKARHTGQGGTNIYPNRRLPASGNDSSMMLGATPFNEDWMRMRIENLGNKMRFRLNDDDVNEDVTPYDPANSIDDDDAYELSVRVAVCVPGLLEPNCRQYSQGWKPEGLIQQYSEDLRLSVFGYLNDPNDFRDGGVLRARQKFVGPNMVVPGVQGKMSNPDVEWDPVTGALVKNPNPADASATQAAYGVTVQDSGVINYLNKFGQMTSYEHKRSDPVSELFYTALRYLRNEGNVPAYTVIPGVTGVDAHRAVDGFPVITNWDDPIQYACQKNVMLGIGDVYTHRDKNLPGSVYSTDEPAMPPEVSGDNDVDVLIWTNRVGQLEGLGNIANTNNWSGRFNSAYIAGLAYYANTTDIRPDDLPGTQTAATHWVDVLEGQSLEAPIENQYYLATKYGGFKLPDDEEFDPATFGGPLPLEWWNTNGETLVSFGPRANPAGFAFPRPDNYYVAGRADAMVESLTTAFAKIAAELRSSASSVAANSTRVDSDTAVFQAAFDSHRWSGDLQAFRITTGGTILSDPVWSGAERLDALPESSISNRNILSILPPSDGGGGSLLSATGVDFLWTSLATSQQDAIRQQPGGGQPVSDTVGQQRLDYLRGSRTLEQPGGPFRQRDSRLGDIVNSDPQFVHNQDFGYELLDQSGAFSSSVASAYRTFRQSGVYQNRPPLAVVGANDGMLHGFHAGLGADGGRELFAFVPHAAFEHLYELTLPAYSHRYNVDGTTRFADAWLGGLGWRTIAVGITGAGGASVFALDITDPEAVSSSDVLWEFTHPEMGYTLGQPAVVPLPNGAFGVVVTSGYTGGTDGRIWILNPANGSIIRTFTLPNSGDLGAPLLADLNGDRVADRIYVGDTAGNMWRFDLEGSNPSQWQPPAGLRSGNTPLPLFVARDPSGVPQAITAPPTSAFNNDGEHALFFGTGSFYRVDDNVVPPNPQVDTFYGLIDRGVPITGRSELLEQEILTEQIAGSMRVRGVTDNEMEPGHSGWYVDLVWKNVYGGPGPRGERVVSRAVVRGDRVIVTTLIPDPDPCSPGGESWLMELNAFSGGRLNYAVYDITEDGEFDEDDWITVTLPGGEEVLIPPSAVAPEIGIMDTPAVISGVGPDENEIKVVSGSSGQLIRISERGGIGIGRQSWRQLR